jgi:hypothetical protein
MKAAARRITSSLKAKVLRILRALTINPLLCPVLLNLVQQDLYVPSMPPLR